MGENRITRLAIQKRNPNRVNIYLDGEFAFGLYRETACWLESGQILSDEKINELLAKDKKAEAYKRALDYISYKPRTTRETEKKLLDEGYDETLVSETIDTLTENGLLNDAQYAELWVEERQRLKPRSSRMLQYELRRKGIPDELIQTALEDVDNFQAALEIAEHRAERYSTLPAFEFRKKLGNYLAGKGFTYDVIREVVIAVREKIDTSGNQD